MLESVYQARLIKKLEARFPGCIVLKNDSSYRQGIPDLLVLYKDRWALLEAKASADAPQQPNQEHYIGRGNELSFAAFIFPENEKEVLDALQSTFESRRKARVSQR
jgi:hypothetical protein